MTQRGVRDYIGYYAVLLHLLNISRACSDRSPFSNALITALHVITLGATLCCCISLNISKA